MTTYTSASYGPTLAERSRIVALDVLRGFALCGILLVNIPWQVFDIRMRIGPASGGSYRSADLLELTVHGRFFPIFSFLFGVSFALFLDMAKTRARYPRLVLVRRLVVLGVLGVAHQQLHPGEALLPYAAFGLLVLLPVSWLPRWSGLVFAALGLAGGVWAGGGMLLIPGLFLVGLTAVRFGLIDTLEQRRTQLATVCAVSFAVLVPATAWQVSTMDSDRVAALAGLVGAVAYGSGLLLVLRTAVGTALGRILAPMGRMALTNYVSATVLAAVAGPLIGLPQSAHYGRMLVLASAMLAGQAWLSRWWLGRHRYGPMEWVWRRLTWGKAAATSHPGTDLAGSMRRA
jgi:uncharacterized protein